MEYGKRIIYDKKTGYVLNYVMEEMSGDLIEGLRPTEIDFIDLPFGSSILNGVIAYHIDVTKDKSITPIEQLIIIDSVVEHIPTYEELQQQILIAQGVI